MTWWPEHGCVRVNDPEIKRAIAKAVSERGKWSLDDVEHLAGPQWGGSNRYLNPLYATRPRAFLFGGLFYGLGLLVGYGFLYGPPGMVPRSLAALLLVIWVLPGMGALLYAFALPRFLESSPWRLQIRHNALTYERPKDLLDLFVSLPASWSVPLDAVARVETGATAEWEPTRRHLLHDKPVPREEVQTFLFMADGTRRVIAIVHGDRESMSALAHSIRSSLQAVREYTERATGGHAARSGSGEGFNI